jgi:Family of unknown function (DUF6011)
MTTTTTESPRCLRCGRRLRSAKSISTGYGAGCRARIRAAAKLADLAAWTQRQLEDARELIEDGGVVPTSRPGVFRTVSSDGEEFHLTHAQACNCPAGLRSLRCYHRAAVALVLAGPR